MILAWISHSPSSSVVISQGFSTTSNSLKQAFILTLNIFKQMNFSFCHFSCSSQTTHPMLHCKLRAKTFIYTNLADFSHWYSSRKTTPSPLSTAGLLVWLFLISWGQQPVSLPATLFAITPEMAGSCYPGVSSACNAGPESTVRCKEWNQISKRRWHVRRFQKILSLLFPKTVASP